MPGSESFDVARALAASIWLLEPAKVVKEEERPAPGSPAQDEPDTQEKEQVRGMTPSLVVCSCSLRAQGSGVGVTGLPGQLLEIHLGLVRWPGAWQGWVS